MSVLVPIGVLADVTLGKMLQSSAKSKGDRLRPYLRAAHVQPGGQLDMNVSPKEMWFSESERRSLTLKAGDVVVVEGGAGFGRATYLDRDMPDWGFQNSILRLRGKSPSDGRYLNYALSHGLESGAIEAACNGATFAHFTAEKVGRFRVPLHEVRMRERIADYLDRETSEIDAMIGKLDDLSGTLELRRTAAIDKVLSSYKYVSLEAGWSVTDCLHRTAQFVETGDRFVVSIGQLDGYAVDTSSALLTTASDFESLRSGGRAPVTGDAVMSRNASVGKIAVVTADTPSFALGQDVVLLRPRAGESGALLSYAMASTRNQAALDLAMLGTTFKRINVAAIKKLPWPHIDSREQIDVVAHLDEVTGKIDAMLAKVAELKSLLIERRAALITDIVTGQKEIA